jgi:hypothetical protein
MSGDGRYRAVQRYVADSPTRPPLCTAGIPVCMVADSLLPLGRWREEENTVHDDRSVKEMAGEVLMRQAKARADRTGESIEEALEAVLNTEAGTQLRELRDAPHGEESVEEWQVGMARERAQERAEDLGDHLEEPPEHPTHG